MPVQLEAMQDYDITGIDPACINPAGKDFLSVGWHRKETAQILLLFFLLKMLGLDSHFKAL